MLVGRLIRRVRRHSRAIVVWAAMPLALFNGRTIVGCGCFGHFESVCNCGCCSGQLSKAGCSCCDGRCCCNQSASAGRGKATENISCHASCHSLQSHRCRSFILHEATPVTIAPHVDGVDLQESLFILAISLLPRASSQSHSGQVADFDTGPPPNDLVVTLHRLVI